MSGKLLAAAVIAAGAYVWSSTSDEDESAKSKSPKKKSNLKNKNPPKSRRLIVEPPFGAASPASPAANQPSHSRTPSMDTPMRPATYHTDESESMGLTMVRSLSRDGLNNMVRSLSRTSLSNLVDSAKKRLSVTEDDDDPSLVFTSTTEVMQPSHYHTDESESFTLQAASQVKSMVRSLSKTRLSDLAMSPTQNMRLDEDPSIANVNDNEGHAKKSTRLASSTTSSSTSSSASSPSSNTTFTRKSTRNTDSFIVLCIAVVLVGYGLFLAMSYPEEMLDPYTLFMDVFTFKRVPTTAQDIPSAIVATAIVLPFMWVIDCFVARRFFNNEIAQWYFLHSVANAFVVLLAVPDFYFAALQPMNSLSVQYCLSSSLPSWACNDWPTCIIIAVHTYHMCAFKLNGEDLFHHLTFVPIIGGGHFLYPWGLAGNILCFFISGLPGMIDYFLLALYKDRLISSLTEKRINLSINVWLRSPGIVTFCCLVTTCWLQPAIGTNPKDLMPWYGFMPAMLVVYYNGQYYGMRVVGNYYIRITQDEYAKIPNVKLPRTKVELHAS